MLDGHCAVVGRDPAEIESSVTLWYDPAAGPGALAEAAASYAAVGVDIVVVYLPIPHTPAVLDPIAEALTSLATDT